MILFAIAWWVLQRLRHLLKLIHLQIQIKIVQVADVNGDLSPQLRTERGLVRSQVVAQIVAMVAHVQRHTMISFVGLLVPLRLRRQ
jgi:hypothetical protein